MLKDRVLRKKLKDKYRDEQVYVVLRENTMHIRDGATFPDKESIGNAVRKLNGKFVFRVDAEYEPALQQIIPYVLVLSPDRKKVFVTERLSGEERLEGSFAIGAGGHINPKDMAGEYDIFRNAAYREVFEELEIKGCGKLRPVGFVRDLESSTADHLGIIYEMTALDVAVKEKEKLRGFWMTPCELIASYERFESWARKIIDILYRTGSLKAVSAFG